MKKLIPVLLFVIVTIAAVYFFVFRTPPQTENSEARNSSSPGSAEQNLNAGNDFDENGDTDDANDIDINQTSDEDLGIVDEEIKSASEVYKNSKEALEAVRKGAADYDDTILEQFTLPGEDCTWCPEFYKSVRELLTSPDITQEQKGYFAEILATSGQVENLSNLVELIKNSKSPEEADMLAESLELALGNDKVVQFLGEQMGSSNETLKEASVAAVTNQGTRLAADLLYKETVKNGDPDGFYQKGIGLGEFIPEPEAYPFLQDIVKKRDQYSHLAVKALLNSGIEGMRIVFDELSNSKDSEFDRKMLADAVDHVNFDDETEAFLKKEVENTKQPLRVEVAKKFLEEFKNAAIEGTEDEEIAQ